MALREIEKEKIVEILNDIGVSESTKEHIKNITEKKTFDKFYNLELDFSNPDFARAIEDLFTENEVIRDKVSIYRESKIILFRTGIVILGQKVTEEKGKISNIIKDCWPSFNLSSTYILHESVYNDDTNIPKLEVLYLYDGVKFFHKKA